MVSINLTATTTEQIIIKDYLENNASDTLADKINNGIPAEKEGKRLINKKTLDTFMKYAYEEAQKQAEKGARYACIGQDTVFGWAVHYFEEDSLEGILYNEDGTEYKPPKPVVKPKSVTAPTVKPKPQMSLFDMLETKPAETVNIQTETGETEDIDEQEDEPEYPAGLRQVSETEYVDEDGIIYEITETKKETFPEILTELFGDAIVMR